MRLKKKLLFVAVFFCVLAIIFVANFAHELIQQKIMQVQQERQSVINTEKLIIELRNEYSNLDEYMKKLEERYQLANKSLPGQINEGEFIKYLQHKAIKNQVKITNITPNETELIKDESKNVTSLLINLKFECGYIQLINFLKELEDSERLMKLENLSIISKNNGELLICEINFIIYALEQN